MQLRSESNAHGVICWWTVKALLLLLLQVKDVNSNIQNTVRLHLVYGETHCVLLCNVTVNSRICFSVFFSMIVARYEPNHFGDTVL